MHHCDLPPRRGNFYEVYRCPVCRQWWFNKCGFWLDRSRLFLFFAGYNDQCRSFLRHNGKGRS